MGEPNQEQPQSIKVTASLSPEFVYPTKCVIDINDITPTDARQCLYFKKTVNIPDATDYIDSPPVPTSMTTEQICCALFEGITTTGIINSEKCRTGCCDIDCGSNTHTKYCHICCLVPQCNSCDCEIGEIYGCGCKLCCIGPHIGNYVTNFIVCCATFSLFNKFTNHNTQ